MIYKAHEIPGFRPTWVIHDTDHDCWFKTEIGKKTYWVMRADRAYRFTQPHELNGVMDRLERKAEAAMERFNRATRPIIRELAVAVALTVGVCAVITAVNVIKQLIW